MWNVALCLFQRDKLISVLMCFLILLLTWTSLKCWKHVSVGIWRKFEEMKGTRELRNCMLKLDVVFVSGVQDAGQIIWVYVVLLVTYPNNIWMFPKIGGKPRKWMVYNGKPYEQMDDLGIQIFLGWHPYKKTLKLFNFFFGPTPPSL